jgi:hypothetical protein
VIDAKAAASSTKIRNIVASMRWNIERTMFLFRSYVKAGTGLFPTSVAGFELCPTVVVKVVFSFVGPWGRADEHSGDIRKAIPHPQFRRGPR